MIRENNANWIKTGFEYFDDTKHASAVITREFSDWSVLEIPSNDTKAPLWLNIKREKETVEVKYSLDGQKYNLLRLGYLSESAELMVGIMAAAPDGLGFDVTFENFKITLSE